MGEAKKSCSSKSWNICHDNVGDSCYQLCFNGCIGKYYFTSLYSAPVFPFFRKNIILILIGNKIIKFIFGSPFANYAI